MAGYRHHSPDRVWSRGAVQGDGQGDQGAHQAVIEAASTSDSANGTISQRVGDLYLAGMDTAAIDKRGFEPVQPYLQAIESIRDASGIMAYVAAQARISSTPFVAQNIQPDDKNSTHYLPTYYQTGLGLPDRDYYFKTDKATLAVVEAYKTYLSTLFKLTGDSAADHTERVYALEKKMAAAHKTNVQLMDPEKNYHKTAVADADKAMPVVGWSSLLKNLGVHADSINLSQPEYYQALNTLLKSVSLDDWKLYLRVHTLDNAAGDLSHGFESAAFAYYNQALQGQKQIKPRWERIYHVIDGNLGEALGQLYVRQYFSPEAKQRMTELVDNLQKAFANRIDHLDWMGDTTKQKAKEKLFAMIKKVAYPDKWRDYSHVSIQKDKYFESLASCRANEYQYNLAQLGRPVDRTRWGMTPPTDNAYYNPTNHMRSVSPRASSVSRCSTSHSDDALNYGRYRDGDRP